MCRILYAASAKPFAGTDLLSEFASCCKLSREYQGHGYGISRYRMLKDCSAWDEHRSVVPIWDDKLPEAIETTVMVAHARSAFRDEGICVENNMPFAGDKVQFVFNGELRGVRLKEQGRIGAEKIFNVIRSQYQGSWAEALRNAMRLITSRTRYVRAMNVLITDGARAYVYSDFSEAPDYFTLQVHRGSSSSAERLVICSERLPSLDGWEALPVRSVEEFAV